MFAIFKTGVEQNIPDTKTELSMLFDYILNEQNQQSELTHLKSSL
jgi:hypothetical protein